MTLLELCEPLFQYICRLNRAARKGGTHEVGQVRAEIKNLLDDMRNRASSDVGLSEQYDKIYIPLVFFVDLMIRDSKLNIALEWEEMGAEMGELAGDERFFDLLDETLMDQSAAATERLAVYYTCIGLGFDGIYAGQTEPLQKAMMKCSARISKMMEVDEAARICPEAYEDVDTRDLVQPPSRKLAGIGITFVGLLIILLITNIFLFKWYSSELVDSLDKIVSRQASIATPQSLPAETPDMEEEGN